MTASKIFTSAAVALACMAAGSAFADSYDVEHPITAPTASTVTRAQVEAELTKAYQEGDVRQLNDSTYPVVKANSGALAHMPADPHKLGAVSMVDYSH